MDALPETKAAFFVSEDRVLLRAGFSEVLKRGIKAQYFFLGGRQSEWVAYLQRDDYDADMWSFRRPEEVRAFAGVSSVLKKKA